MGVEQTRLVVSCRGTCEIRVRRIRRICTGVSRTVPSYQLESREVRLQPRKSVGVGAFVWEEYLAPTKISWESEIANVRIGDYLIPGIGVRAGPTGV